MKRPLIKPCAEWAELLAAVSLADLSPAAQAALKAHLVTCPACAAIKAEYQRMDARIRALPSVRPLDGLPPALVQLWAEEDRRTARTRRPTSRVPAEGRAMQTIEHPDIQSSAPSLLLRQRRRRIPRLMSTLRAVTTLALVVVVIAALFISRASTPFAGNGQWVEISTLRNTPALPIFAPGNPRVIYEALPSGLRRSDDQGATWHKLPMPTDARITSQGHLILFVSPLDAHIVYLTLPSATALAPEQCPASEAAIYPCAIQFYSQDGGAHWKPLHLPLPGVLGSPIFFDNPSLIVGFPNIGALRAQGNRLYSTIGEPSIGVDNQGGAELVGNGARLVTSTDGGVTWQVADAVLAERSQLVCDYAPVPTGSIVFALTESTVCGGAPTDLWRSDDAGKHWTRVGALPDRAIRGLSVASQGDAAQPLIYLSTQDLGAQVNTRGILQASTDGGKTWHAAPNPDPIEGRWFLSPLGMLGDGSVVVASLPVLGKATATFIAWKAGESTWRQLAPPIDNMAYLLATPDAAGGNDTLWLVTSAGQDAYTVYRY
jgi:photosystem II stability/assembly factor-like uncharacterized protein